MPASRALRFIDSQGVDALLAPLVPDAADRAFVRRCILEEGPIHHRGANYVLLTLMARLAEQLGVAAGPAAQPVRVPMRLPPHLVHELGDSAYPLPLATRALDELAGNDPERLDAMIDCLTDGPAQHALANVLMVNLLDGLLAAGRRD